METCEYTWLWGWWHLVEVEGVSSRKERSPLGWEMTLEIPLHNYRTHQLGVE